MYLYMHIIGVVMAIFKSENLQNLGQDKTLSHGGSRRAGLVICILALFGPGLFAQESSTLEKYTEVVTSEGGEEIQFEMIALPGGTFTMGSPEDEAGRDEDEGPQHSVRLSPFYLSSTEMTLDLFIIYYQETMTEKKVQFGTEEPSADVDTISGPTPVYGDLAMGSDHDHPAVAMTWHNAVVFCRWLSEKTGKEYRLPTEAEWEYACRAGTSNLFGTVNEEEKLVDTTWYDENSDGLTQAVATKEPNAWGLHDMSGNVREWVYDFYSPEAYSRSVSEDTVVNPTGPESGKVHVARGGDYSSFPEELRCSARAFEDPDWRALDPQMPKSEWWLPFMDIIGFRVARSAE
jgi:formylglycine-generating enzyme required for sulfatase activity